MSIFKTGWLAGWRIPSYPQEHWAYWLKECGLLWSKMLCRSGRPHSSTNLCALLHKHMMLLHQKFTGRNFVAGILSTEYRFYLQNVIEQNTMSSLESSVTSYWWWKIFFVSTMAKLENGSWCPKAGHSDLSYGIKNKCRHESRTVAEFAKTTEAWG